jgi:hypothetical protein
VGKAITNASNQAFNQIRTIPSANPTLKAEITNDIMLDINNAIKNEKTWDVYLGLINLKILLLNMTERPVFMDQKKNLCPGYKMRSMFQSV